MTREFEPRLDFSAGIVPWSQKRIPKRQFVYKSYPKKYTSPYAGNNKVFLYVT